MNSFSLFERKGAFHDYHDRVTAPGRVALAIRVQASGLANRIRTNLGRLGRPGTEFVPIS